jgi:hypothetical protein
VADSQNTRRPLLVCLGLGVAIVVVHLPSWHAGFVAFDDNDYVASSDMVTHGLSWQGIKRAFTTAHASAYALRDGRQAVQLAEFEVRQSIEKDARLLGILAAANAETGDFSRAKTTAQLALQGAEAERKSALADALRSQLACYRNGQPFRDPPVSNGKQ